MFYFNYCRTNAYQNQNFIFKLQGEFCFHCFFIKSVLVFTNVQLTLQTCADLGRVDPLETSNFINLRCKLHWTPPSRPTTKMSLRTPPLLENFITF